MIDWEKIRNDFPVTKNCAYFMSAGLSPIPTPVLRNIEKEYRKLNEHGDIGWISDVKKYNLVLEQIGRRINCNGGDLAFLQNTSTAMSLIALALKRDIKKDFNIVSLTDEFPSTTVPFEYQKVKVKYVKPQDGRYSVEEIIKATDNDTAAVVLSFVQYGTGFRMDLDTLGKKLNERGILFIVNATQGFPIFPIDVKKAHINAMTSSMHKWGFTGTIGSLFYTSPEFRKKHPSPIAGWLSVAPKPGEFIWTDKNGDIKLKDSAEQYMCGTLNFNVLNSFGVALDYLDSIGADAIRERILELTGYLIERVKELGVRIVSPVLHRNERSQIVTIDLGAKTKDIIKKLEEKKIYTSFRAGNMRISVNFFNSKEEIDLLTGEIYACIRG